MKEIKFILLFIFTINYCFGQTEIKGRYISDLSNYNYNRWKISKGDSILIKNNSKGRVIAIRKYVQLEEEYIYLFIKTSSGEKVVYNIDDDTRNGNIVLPEGIKARLGKSDDYLRHIQDTAVKEWKLDILPLKNGKVNYTSVIEVPNITKDELYNRVKLWFAISFKDSKEVLQIDDKENGKIIGKGTSTVFWIYGFAGGTDVLIRQLFDISIKDGKVRLIITDINCKWYVSSSAYTSGGWSENNIEDWSTNKNGKVFRVDNTKKFFTSVNSEIMGTIFSFESFIKNPTVSTNGKEDNW